MRLLAYEHDGRAALGVRLENAVVPLAAIAKSLPATLEDLLALGPAALDSVRSGCERTSARVSLDELRLLPPLSRPRRIICVGLNYADHAAESQFEPPKYPALFTRFRESFVGHGTALERPALSEQFDYEGELVAVIGRRGRHIERAQALGHVAGYTIFNDASVRDYQFKSTQWMVGKNFDRTGACGPELVTAEELPAGAAGLALRTRVNGTTVQSASTRDMIFDVPTLVHLCSEIFELAPGDMIVTGTPAGVGFARKPPLFLHAGDVCEVEIEQLGTLRNPVVDEAR